MSMTARTFIIDTSARMVSFIRFLSKLGFDKPWKLTLEEYVGQRTLKQNARLWKLHGLAAEVTGYLKDDLHEIMLCKHFGYYEIEFAEMTKHVPLKRSSVRNKKEFKEYLDFVEMFYADTLGVWLGKDDE